MILRTAIVASFLAIVSFPALAQDAALDAAFNNLNRQYQAAGTAFENFTSAVAAYKLAVDDRLRRDAKTAADTAAYWQAYIGNPPPQKGAK